MQINGTNYGNYSESAINAAPSGQIEVDARITSGVFVNRYSSVGIISGNIASTDFCVCSSSDGKKMNLYVNISHRYRDFKITKISEGQENVTSPNIFEFTDEYYGTSAPEGAVYAVVRNRASTDADGNELVNTSTEQTISGRKTLAQSGGRNPLRVISAWEKTGNSTTHYNYIEFLDSNNSRTGIIGQKTAGTDRYGVYLQGGNEGSLQVLSDGENVYFLLSKNPPATDNTTSIATTKWINDKGYLTAIPAASQTVLGGVKVYTDGDGYLCIDTE